MSKGQKLHRQYREDAHIHTHGGCLSLATFEEELEKVLLKLTIVSFSAGMVRDNRWVFLAIVQGGVGSL